MQLNIYTYLKPEPLTLSAVGCGVGGMVKGHWVPDELLKPYDGHAEVAWQ